MQAPVLVLNANFEPVNVCDTRRAILLLLAEKASLVANGRGEIKLLLSPSFGEPLATDGIAPATIVETYPAGSFSSG